MMETNNDKAIKSNIFYFVIVEAVSKWKQIAKMENWEWNVSNYKLKLVTTSTEVQLWQFFALLISLQLVNLIIICI